MRISGRWPNVAGATIASAAVFVSFLSCEPQGPELRIAKCSSCKLTIRSVAILGRSSDSVGATIFTHVAQLGGAHYLTGPITDPGQLAIYRSDGTLERVIGRQGSGPGELQLNLGPLIETASGSVVVVDILNNRYAEVDSLGNIGLYGRQADLTQVGIGLPDGRLVVSGQMFAPERRRWSVHVVERGGRVVRSFSEMPAVRRGAPAQTRVLATARNGGIWFSPHERYEITLADSLGNVSTVLTRQFSSKPANASGTREDWVVSIYEDTSGYVWVSSGHRGAPPVPTTKREQPTMPSFAALAAGLTSTIDLIDPAKRTVIHSETFNAPPIRILQSGLGSRHVIDASGDLRVELVSLQLIGAPPRRR